MVEFNESEIGGSHVIKGSQQLYGGNGIAIKRINMNSKCYEIDILPYMGGQEGKNLNQTNKKVEDLTEGFDRVENFHFGSKGGEKSSKVQNLVDIPIQNESMLMVKPKNQ